MAKHLPHAVMKMTRLISTAPIYLLPKCAKSRMFLEYIYTNCILTYLYINIIMTYIYFKI